MPLRCSTYEKSLVLGFIAITLSKSNDIKYFSPSMVRTLNIVSPCISPFMLKDEIGDILLACFILRSAFNISTQAFPRSERLFHEGDSCIISDFTKELG